jgi:hypothetical protein
LKIKKSRRNTSKYSRTLQFENKETNKIFSTLTAKEKKKKRPGGWGRDPIHVRQQPQKQKECLNSKQRNLILVVTCQKI